jgi:hypothetical protein
MYNSECDNNAQDFSQYFYQIYLVSHIKIRTREDLRVIRLKESRYKSEKFLKYNI